jgi:hypothetical protein
VLRKLASSWCHEMTSVIWHVSERETLTPICGWNLVTVTRCEKRLVRRPAGRLSPPLSPIKSSREATALGVLTTAPTISTHSANPSFAYVNQSDEMRYAVHGAPMTGLPGERQRRSSADDDLPETTDTASQGNPLHLVAAGGRRLSAEDRMVAVAIRAGRPLPPSACDPSSHSAQTAGRGAFPRSCH